MSNVKRRALGVGPVSALRGVPTRALDIDCPLGHGVKGTPCDTRRGHDHVCQARINKAATKAAGP